MRKITQLLSKHYNVKITTEEELFNYIRLLNDIVTEQKSIINQIEEKVKETSSEREFKTTYPEHI